MGTCYKVILMDEFDWGYVGTDKETRKKEFITAYGGYSCELVGQWYGAMVFDVDKNYPLMPERIEVIKQFSDCAYYIADHSLCSIVKIE